MENALENDYDFVRLSSTAGEAFNELTPFKSQFLIEAHRRFLISYLDGLIDEDLQVLWTATTGLCARDQDIRSLQKEIEALKAHETYRLVRNAVIYLKRLLFGMRESDEPQARSADYAIINALCVAFKTDDKRVLYEMKMALREGILVFEQYEAEVVERAGGQLMASLQQALKVVEDYYQRLAEHILALGISIASLSDVPDEEPIPEDTGLPGHGGKL